MPRDGALPPALRDALERETSAVPPADLRRAAGNLSDRYRRGDRALQLSPADRLAYLATRLPATHAAVSSVLAELNDRLPALGVRTLLDLGAGPGTVVLAASAQYDELQRATLVEPDVGFATIGETIVCISRVQLEIARAQRSVDRGDRCSDRCASDHGDRCASDHDGPRLRSPSSALHPPHRHSGEIMKGRLRPLGADRTSPEVH